MIKLIIAAIVSIIPFTNNVLKTPINEPDNISVRTIPFDVFVTINGIVTYHGEATFINEHMVGPAVNPQIFIAGTHSLVVIDIPHNSDVVITTKPPTPQDAQQSIFLGHFGLRLSANGTPIYSGEPWELHIQREAHDPGIAAQVVDSTSHTFKLDQGDTIVARSYFP